MAEGLVDAEMDERDLRIVAAASRAIVRLSPASKTAALAFFEELEAGRPAMLVATTNRRRRLTVRFLPDGDG